MARFPKIYALLLAAAFACAGLVVSGCGRGSTSLATHELSGATMGTTYTFSVVGPRDMPALNGIEEEAQQVLDSVNASMSTYLEDSEVSLFNRSGSTEWFPVSPGLCEVVAAAVQLREITRGAFDITVGPLVEEWGFGPGASRREPPASSSAPALLAADGAYPLQADCGQPAIRRSRPAVAIDLSGIAKGYAVDRVAELFDNRGLRNYLVEIGGEMRLSGHNASRRKWSIAIESPDPGSRTVHAIVEITDTAVATSGDYRNFFEFEGRRYSHIIDPRAGAPVENAVAAVTVLAGSAMAADATATGLLVLGPADGPALAESAGIAALFLSRAESGIVESASSRFTARTDADPAR